MATTFAVTAPTGTGETIWVVGNQAALAQLGTASAVPLTQSGGVWSATVNLPLNTAVQYKYIRKTARRGGHLGVRPEPGPDHPGDCTATWTDTWNGPGTAGPAVTVAVTFAATVTTVVRGERVRAR